MDYLMMYMLSSASDFSQRLTIMNVANSLFNLHKNLS